MGISFFSKQKIFFFVLLLAVLSGIVSGSFFAFTHDLPQIRSLKNYQPSSVTYVYSSDNILLAELFAERREPVPLSSVPPYLVKALVTMEDRNFYNHSGVDIKGILRAIVKDILAGEFVEGASTITQQLSKTLFLTSRKTISRKIKEALIAFQLEKRYTKNEILELYLNQVYFGSGAYGVESASKLFFGKTVKDLTLSECALIAAMPRSPSRYSPLVNKRLAVKRRNIVLKQMLKIGIINDEIYSEAIQSKLNLSDRYKPEIKAPYFIDSIKQQLEIDVGYSKLYREGLVVKTTLNYNLQIAAESATQTGISELRKRMSENAPLSPAPQCALISLDTRTGGILSMVGGVDYSESQFNRSTIALRQPGSAFKPILYAYAIERGIPQSKIILDSPVAFNAGPGGTIWKPENFSKTYQGEITLRNALAKSKNIPAVRLVEMLGPSSVGSFGKKMGISSYLSPNLSLGLGTSEVTLINLTSVYSVFPNRGFYIPPFGVSEVLDKSGRIIFKPKQGKKLAMSREGASIMTNMLEAVVKEGTGKKALKLKRAVAGKTGTTNEYRDALFVGFSPHVATGVWVGCDDFSTLGKWETGAKAALPIWVEFMKSALENEPYSYFDIPDNVVKIYMNSETGLKSSDKLSDSVPAFFLKGTEPTD